MGKKKLQKNKVDNDTSYLGNPNLKPRDQSTSYSKEQLQEFIKCSSNPVYFINNYVKIINVDDGVVPFKLHKFQTDMVKLFDENRFSITLASRQIGKCVCINTPFRRRNRKTGVIVNTTIGAFYASVKTNLNHRQLSEPINKKFIESFDIDDWDVETDTGWSPVTHLHKTIEYDVWTLVTETGLSLRCADDHIVFDENLNEVYVKDLIPLTSKIITKNGPEIVFAVKKTADKENMFDLTVGDDNHRFYTNDILSHNTTCVVAYVLWLSLFNNNYTVAMLANKDTTAKELLYRYQFAYENLPKWMQQGVIVWNKGDIELENGTRVISAATSSSGIRGKSINCLVLDELAHVEPNVQVDFFQSVYPTISSGKSTKIIITSTPRGMELFYKLWTDAIEGRNSYKPLEISWTDVPGRDEKWKKQEIANLGSEEAFNQEYSNQFLGSTNTLITGNVLRSLTYCDPINTIGGCKIFEMPQKNRVYTITVDVAHGAGQDYSAFSVVDVTDMPYKVVATFYKNEQITEPEACISEFHPSPPDPLSPKKGRGGEIAMVSSNSMLFRLSCGLEMWVMMRARPMFLSSWLGVLNRRWRAEAFECLFGK